MSTVGHVLRRHASWALLGTQMRESPRSRCVSIANDHHNVNPSSRRLLAHRGDGEQAGYTMGTVRRPLLHRPLGLLVAHHSPPRVVRRTVDDMGYESACCEQVYALYVASRCGRRAGRGGQGSAGPGLPAPPHPPRPSQVQSQLGATSFGSI